MRIAYAPSTTAAVVDALRADGWQVTSQRPGGVAAVRGRWVRVLEQTSQGWAIVGGGPR